MPQYLLSIYQPDGGVPGAEAMARITTGLHRLNEEPRERALRLHELPITALACGSSAFHWSSDRSDG